VSPRRGSARTARWPLLRRLRRSDAAAALLFIAPAFAALVVLRIAPAVSALLTSLKHTDLAGTTTRWAGLSNYDALLHDGGFWHSVKVTVVFNVIVNPLQIVLALGLAVLLTQRVSGTRLWRSLIFLPVAAPMVVSALVWGVAFQPDGLINGLLGALGLHQQPFFTSPSQALWAIIAVVSWIGVGYWMLFLIAGLQDIPREYYDAAAVDGAGRWQAFWRITLPLLRRPLTFVLVADTVANFLVFVPVQILTNGGPQGSTNLIMFEIYNRAYQLGDVNRAQAEVVLLMIIMTAIVAIQFRMMRTER
jgi:multiple sugar transport system permease protein